VTGARTAPDPSADRIRALSDTLLGRPGQLAEASKLFAGAGKTIEIPISGLSMGATLPAGARALVELGAEPHEGDVVVFRQRDRLVAHRLVYRAVRGGMSRYLITRGDARIAPDPPISPADIVGRVTGVQGSDAALPPSPLSSRRKSARIAIGLALAAVRTARQIGPGAASAVAGLLAALERNESLWRLARRSGPARPPAP